MANLVVDIGNTALKAAWTDSMTLGKTFRYQGEMIFDFIVSLTEKNRPEVLVISSVSEISDKDRTRLEKECENLVIVDRKRTETLKRYGLPAWLTPDRAASVLASRYLFKGKGCTIVDFGTTMTIDFTDCDGNYLGGNISPGMAIRFRALNEFTASLPLVKCSPDHGYMGKNTHEAILNGVMNGILFEVRGYIDALWAEKPDAVVIVTGGGGKYMQKTLCRPVVFEERLVMTGLNRILEYQKTVNNEGETNEKGGIYF